MNFQCGKHWRDCRNRWAGQLRGPHGERTRRRSQTAVLPTSPLSAESQHSARRLLAGSENCPQNIWTVNKRSRIEPIGKKSTAEVRRAGLWPLHLIDFFLILFGLLKHRPLHTYLAFTFPPGHPPPAQDLFVYFLCRYNLFIFYF